MTKKEIEFRTVVGKLVIEDYCKEMSKDDRKPSSAEVVGWAALRLMDIYQRTFLPTRDWNRLSRKVKQAKQKWGKS